MGFSVAGTKSKLKSSTAQFLETRFGTSPRAQDLIFHYFQGLWEQVLAVVPISVLQMLVLAIFFQVAPNDPGLQVMGLISAMIGLVFFLDGLRVLTMPLAELIGQELPRKLHLYGVLIVAFFLGVLVTYAEPAIAALRPLAELVDPNRAPYLYYVMNQQQEFLVLAIGMGVGVAAVIGTLRFIKDWNLKPLIFMSLVPTIGCACYMKWGNDDLEPIIGMAWDCGGVTTGPVTVPILLALGIGVMRTQRQKRLATAALEGSVAAGAGQALEGFGIVTLASLFPVLAVELMAIIISIIHPYDEVLRLAQEAAAKGTEKTAIDKSPLREVIFAIRSILPLVAALCLICWIVLRRKLPEVSFWMSAPGEFEDPSVRGGSQNSSKSLDDLDRTSNAVVKWEAQHEKDHAKHASGTTTAGSEMSYGEGSEQGTDHGNDAALKALQSQASETSINMETSSTTAPADVPLTKKTFGTQFNHYLPFILSIITLQGGMILFNIGLTYGFTALGDQTGTTLPAAFLEVPYDIDSPYYSYAGGLILVIVVTFLLGILATRAEPALNVLGSTVDKLSGGAFTKTMLVNAVALGVGIGMSIGGLKILYELPIMYFILVKYTIAVGLTCFTDEAITAVAWDSAGVTTGPVTVPFVLSIGIGFSKAVDSIDGFGMLTVMSVAPIISVLITSILRKPAKAARRELSKHARHLNKSFSKLGRSMSIGRGGAGGRRLKISPSTAMAAFASNAGASLPPTPESSSHGGEEYYAAVAAPGSGQSEVPRGSDMA